MPKTTFQRYEQKFIVSEAQLFSCLPVLEQHMEYDKYCQPNRRPYRICNLYYDMPDHRIIQHSLEKPCYKEKLRLRTYLAPAPLEAPAFLEMKKKINGLVTKRRAVLSLQEANTFLAARTYPDHMSYMTEQVLHEIAYYLKRYPVEPAMYISYLRIALVGQEDPSLRVTFDYNICARSDHLQLTADRFGSMLLGKKEYLMEIKMTKTIPLWLASLLSNLKIYKTSFSKYGTAYTQQFAFAAPVSLQHAI